MGNDQWWFNRVGEFAQQSNPGSAVPNYGLTMDVATAPWDKQANFNSLVNSGVTTKLSPNSPAPVQQPAPRLGNPQQESAGGGLFDWSTYSHAFDWAKNEAEALAGLSTPLNYIDGKFDDLRKEADKKGLTGFERAQFLGRGATESNIADVAKAPGAKQVFWGLNKLNEGAATAFTSASVATAEGGGNPVAQMKDWFKGQTWAKAHDIVTRRHENAGQAFVSMFYDNEIVNSDARYQQLRQHSMVFNTGALAFNTVAAWKFDPNVMLGKGLGAARNIARGKIAEEGVGANIQRQVLSQPTREGAVSVARAQRGVKGRVHGQYGVSLWDKSQNLRSAAQQMGSEQFKNLAPFKASPSGTVMAQLFKDVAHDDDAWNLVFRASIGDPTAVPQLISENAAVADKITAIEMKSLPHMESELERVQTQHAKRLAEQGRTEDDGLAITSHSDWLLDTELKDQLAQVEAVKANLGGYKSHESWLNRTLPSLDPETGTLDSRAANSVFGNLEFVNPGRFSRFHTWRHDEYSPVHRVFSTATKPMLGRVGVVNLNDIDEGGHAVQTYLDQIAHVTKRNHQDARDAVIGKWGRSRTDMERKQVVDELERQGMALVMRKHGIKTPALQDQVAKILQEKRATQWSKMSDQHIYTAARGPKTGKRLHMLETRGEDGALHSVKMPMDPTELPNWKPLMNLTDLDHQLRVHRDQFRELDKAFAMSGTHAASLKAERLAEHVYTTVGETLNSFWKPLALLSIRWPARVVADESMRIMLWMGVLPHLKAWGEGVRNVLYNQGVVRPYEWWGGRKLDTGSIDAESLRTGYDQPDPYDYKAALNPTGAVPVDVGEFGSIDPKRYDKLNETTNKRWQYLRRLEAHRANTRVARKQNARLGDAVSALTKPERPRWAQQFDDRLHDAEQNKGGFYFDPATGKATNKGFAVSVYPGRLRTFGRKPSARDMNYWVEKNSDLLAIPKNRVAVWKDRDTGRWHMDIVRVHKNREDAMLLAARARVNEFYDIEDKFTRYMANEDPYMHYSSPLALPPEPADRVAGVAGDQAPINQEVDEMSRALAAGLDTWHPTRKAVGFGKTKWKSMDGKTVEGENVFGLTRDDPNIWHSVVSSKGAFQALFGGYTKGLGMSRAARFGPGYKVFDVGENAGSQEAKTWAHAWTAYVNHHIRKSPIWRRMLDGQSDEQIEAWLHTTAGRKLRERMGPRGVDPHKWVGDMRLIFDHTLPTDEAKLAARDREVSPNEVDNLIPHEKRNEIHGQDILLAAGLDKSQLVWKHFVQKMYDVLGSMPTDALVRHPFAKNLYNLRMSNYLSSVPAEHITPEVLAAAEASARAYAMKHIRKMLYNIADDNHATHMLRFVSPFFQAQLEVLQRYAHIWTEKPESFARTLLLFGKTQGNHGLWYTVDQDGHKTDKFNPDGQVVFQVNDAMRALVNQIPGLKHSLDQVGSLAIPESSMNLILQGNGGVSSFLPSLGPLVTVPANEFYFQKHPFADKGALYNYMFPFGSPQGGDPLARTSNAMEPAWLRRTWTALTGNFDDSAFASRYSYHYQDLVQAWQDKHNRQLPASLKGKLIKQAWRDTKAEWMLRAASSFLSPVPVTEQSPQQFYIDLARKYRAKYGLNADQKFYDDHPEYFRYFQEVTKSMNGLAPTVKAARGYAQNKGLIQEAPLLAGVLAGGNHGKFNYGVYAWEKGQKVAPGSSVNMRETLSPQQRIDDAEVSQGWIEYGKLSSAIDAELRRRGLSSIMDSRAADLRQIKDQQINVIVSRNPAWQDAYQSRDETLGSWLQQAYAVAGSPKLDGRTDIQGLRAYLLSRAKMQDTLLNLYHEGVISSPSLAGTNPVTGQVSDSDLVKQRLTLGWQSYIKELTSKNLQFAEVYHRYLEGDDLTIYVPPEQMK